jgi:hypothetical protein
MMLYRALRRMARIALAWYYADLVVQGSEHVPTKRSWTRWWSW